MIKVDLYLLLLLFLSSTVWAYDAPLVDCEVTVVDMGGRPVAGAGVLAVDGMESLADGVVSHRRLAEGVTDAGGRLQLRLPTSEYPAVLVAFKPGLALCAASVDRRALRSRVFCQLEPAAVLRGTVVDGEGRPVEGAVVQVTPRSSSAFFSGSLHEAMDLAFLKTKTDAAGRFVFEVMSEDMTTDFCVFHPDYARRFTHPFSMAIGLAYRPGQEDIVIPLEPTCEVIGKVVDEAGRGLAGVPLHARLLDDERKDVYCNGRHCFRTVSGAEGEFAFSNVPTGQIFITTGFGMVTEDQSAWPSLGCLVRPRSGRQVYAKVKVQKGAVIEFVTIDSATKELISNATVHLMYKANTDIRFCYQTLGRTDGRGRVRLTYIPGTYAVGFNAEGYSSPWPPMTKLDPTIKRIPLYMQPQASIGGTVLDGEGRQAAGVYVNLRGGMAGDLTRADGTFALRFEPSSSHIYLLARDAERGLCGLAEVREDQSEYTLRLEKGAAVRGHVKDEAGRPIRGALVTVNNQGSQTLTDSDGNFFLSGLHPTREGIAYSFQVYAAGYGSVEVRKVAIENTEADVVLDDFVLKAADLSVRGVVVDEGGKPVPDLPVSLSGAGGGEWKGQPHQACRSDEQGRFHFRKVCDAAVQIQAGHGRAPHAVLYAWGGDQDLKVVFPREGVHPEHPTMVGRAMPPLEHLNPAFDPNEAQGKRAAVCFWSLEPDVFREAVTFSKQAEALKNDLWGCFVSSQTTLQDKQAQAASQLAFPDCQVQWREMYGLRRRWGARRLPWFVVTDAAHVIVYEGASAAEALAALRQDTLEEL